MKKMAERPCDGTQVKKTIGAAITISATAASPIVVVADPQRIEQLLANLISNAFKFTPSGGRVLVRARREGDRATLEVTDTGMGIPANEQQQLFERFFRTSTATANAIPGTGLGLAIAKAIAEKHHGSIAFESVEGAGTTFRVSLPAG